MINKHNIKLIVMQDPPARAYSYIAYRKQIGAGAKSHTKIKHTGPTKSSISITATRVLYTCGFVRFI